VRRKVRGKRAAETLRSSARPARPTPAYDVHGNPGGAEHQRRATPVQVVSQFITGLKGGRRRHPHPTSHLTHRKFANSQIRPAYPHITRRRPTPIAGSATQRLSIKLTKNGAQMSSYYALDKMQKRKLSNRKQLQLPYLNTRYLSFLVTF